MGLSKWSVVRIRAVDFGERARERCWVDCKIFRKWEVEEREREGALGVERRLT